jgi:hypothetical protein
MGVLESLTTVVTMLTLRLEAIEAKAAAPTTPTAPTTPPTRPVPSSDPLAASICHPAYLFPARPVISSGRRPLPEPAADHSALRPASVGQDDDLTYSNAANAAPVDRDVHIETVAESAMPGLPALRRDLDLAKACDVVTKERNRDLRAEWLASVGAESTTSPCLAAYDPKADAFRAVAAPPAPANANANVNGNGESASSLYECAFDVAKRDVLTDRRCDDRDRDRDAARQPQPQPGPAADVGRGILMPPSAAHPTVCEFRITFADRDPAFIREVAEKFAGLPNVTSQTTGMQHVLIPPSRGSVAYVSPTNSLLTMDSGMFPGIDKVYTTMFPGIQERVKSRLIDLAPDSCTELGRPFLPIGWAMLTPVGPEMPKTFLLSVPTLALGQDVSTTRLAYLAFLATLRVAISAGIDHLVVPGMCAGHRDMSVAIAVAQMREAYDVVVAMQAMQAMQASGLEEPSQSASRWLFRNASIDAQPSTSTESSAPGVVAVPSQFT